MPTGALKSMATKSHKSQSTLERYYSDAKESYENLEDKSHVTDKWAYIMGIVKKRAGLSDALDIDGETINEYIEMKHLSEDVQDDLRRERDKFVNLVQKHLDSGFKGGPRELSHAVAHSLKIPPQDISNQTIIQVGKMIDNHKKQTELKEGVQYPGGYDSSHDARTIAQTAARHAEMGNNEHYKKGVELLAKKRGISHEDAASEVESHRSKQKSFRQPAPAFGGESETIVLSDELELLNEDEFVARHGKDVYDELVKARKDQALKIKTNRNFWKDATKDSTPKPSVTDINKASKIGTHAPMKPTPANLKAASKSAKSFATSPLGPNPHDTETYSACGHDDAVCAAKDAAAVRAIELKQAYKYTRNVLGMKENTTDLFLTRENEVLEEELFLMNEALQEVINESPNKGTHNMGDVISSFQLQLRGGRQERSLRQADTDMLNMFGKHLSKHADQKGNVTGDQIKAAYVQTLKDYRGSSHVSQRPGDYEGRGLVRRGRELWQTDPLGNASKKIVGGRPVEMEPGSEEDIKTRKKPAGPSVFVPKYQLGPQESACLQDMVDLVNEVLLIENDRVECTNYEKEQETQEA